MFGPRNETLEAAIRADRDNPAAYDVYADWLQTQDSPVGELIILERSERGEPSDIHRARANQLRARLALPSPSLLTATSHWGLWRSIRLENGDDWMNEAFDVVGFAQSVFGHPLCVALEELAIGVLRWDHNARDVPLALQQAGLYPWAGELARLHLGDTQNVDTAHHVVGEVGATISAVFPRLRDLIVHSGEQSWRGEGETFSLAGLELPELRALAVQTCAMTTARLAPILDAELPALESLELWFGSLEADAHWELADLAPLLAGDRFPKLRSLGLRNTDRADELAYALCDSAIAKRISALDVSMGTLGAEGVAAFVHGARAFTRLERLVVGDNFLIPDQIAELRAAFPRCEVVSESQKEDDLSIPGEVHRYVSVHE